MSNFIKKLGRTLLFTLFYQTEWLHNYRFLLSIRETRLDFQVRHLAKSIPSFDLHSLKQTEHAPTLELSSMMSWVGFDLIRKWPNPSQPTQLIVELNSSFWQKLDTIVFRWIQLFFHSLKQQYVFLSKYGNYFIIINA